jgi:hypothetical protein
MAEEKKGVLDIIEVVSKIVSGLGIGILSLLIGLQAGSIAELFKTGEFAQTLIQDLANPDTTLRQEVALVALDRTVGDQNEEMVLEISEEIWRNSAYESRAGQIALAIIQRRDSNRHKLLVKQVKRQLAKSAAVPDRIEADDTAYIVPTQQVKQLVERTLSNVVYIQYSGGEKTFFKQYQTRLEEFDLNVARTKEVFGGYKSEVRYFHPGDINLAEDICRKTKAFFNEKYRKLPARTRLIKGYDTTLARGQIEVWINMKDVESITKKEVIQMQKQMQSMRKAN